MGSIERRLRKLESRKLPRRAPSPASQRALEVYLDALEGREVEDRADDPELEAYFAELAEQGGGQWEA